MSRAVEFPCDVAFIDLEANADRADVSDHEVIEIGAMKYVAGKVSTFETFVRLGAARTGQEQCCARKDQQVARKSA